MKRLAMAVIVLCMVALGAALAHQPQTSAQPPTPQQAVCQFFARAGMATPAPFAAVFGCPPAV